MKEVSHGIVNGAPLTPAYNPQQAQMAYQGEASPHRVKDSASGPGSLCHITTAAVITLGVVKFTCMYIVLPKGGRQAVKS